MKGFFMKSKPTTRKRKMTPKNYSKTKKIGQDMHVIDDDGRDGDDDSELSGYTDESENDSEEREETSQEKKLRLAKDYIQQLEQNEQDKDESTALDRDAISHRLQQDMLDDAGRLQKIIAHKLIEPDTKSFKILKGHRLPLTAVSISSDNKVIFSASKDGCIIKWELSSGIKLGKIPVLKKSEKTLHKGHYGQVLALALSTDFKFLASSGQDHIVNIWNPDTLTHLHTFTGHRDQVTALAFRRGQNQLFSASHDKTVKVWNVDDMAYVETLFGHEDAVLDATSLMRDHLVTCGGRDRTVRLWKIPEETQLVFQTNIGSSIDCVTMLNEDYFLSGGDNSLSIWFTRKKKPITLRTRAHISTCEVNSNAWITCVSALPFTDLVASGSNDGFVRLWKCEKSFRALMPLFSIPVCGFVNAISFSANGEFLVCAVGKEHRLGRWTHLNDAKNRLLIIPLYMKNDSF